MGLFVDFEPVWKCDQIVFHLKVHRKWTKNEPEVNWKWSESDPKVFWFYILEKKHIES